MNRPLYYLLTLNCIVENIENFFSFFVGDFWLYTVRVKIENVTLLNYKCEGSVVYPVRLYSIKNLFYVNS